MIINLIKRSHSSSPSFILLFPSLVFLISKKTLLSPSFIFNLQGGAQCFWVNSICWVGHRHCVVVPARQSTVGVHCPPISVDPHSSHSLFCDLSIPEPFAIEFTLIFTLCSSSLNSSISVVWMDWMDVVDRDRQVSFTGFNSRSDTLLD